MGAYTCHDAWCQTLINFYTQGPTIAASSQGSFGIPNSCTSSEDCDFLVTYQKVDGNKVEFVLSGKDGWAGVGFSDDQLMVSSTWPLSGEPKKKILRT